MLAVLTVALFVLKSQLMKFLESAEFQHWIVKKVEQTLDAKVTLSPLTWRKGEMEAEHFALTKNSEKNRTNLVLEGNHARTDGISHRTVLVPEITVNRLDLSIAPRSEQPTSDDEAAPSANLSHEPSSADPELPRWLRRFLPDSVDVEIIRISSGQVSVGPMNAPLFLLTNTRADLYPDFRTHTWEIRANGGKLALPNRPEMSMKNFTVRWNGDELYLDQVSVGIFKDGFLESTGVLTFTPKQEIDVTTEFSAIQVTDLIEDTWRERLSGTVRGTVRSRGAMDSPVYEGSATLSDGMIQSLPILKTIASYTRSERFERFVLDQARADFRRDGERLELRNIVLQSDGLARIEGSVDIVGNQLDGKLRVGVTPGTMRWIPGAERLVFTEDRDGFLWTPMSLTGTTDQPREDLTSRLIAAAGRSLVEDTAGSVIDAAKKLVAPDTVSPSESTEKMLLDQGKKVLDQVVPFLKGR